MFFSETTFTDLFHHIKSLIFLSFAQLSVRNNYAKVNKETSIKSGIGKGTLGTQNIEMWHWVILASCFWGILRIINDLAYYFSHPEIFAWSFSSVSVDSGSEPQGKMSFWYLENSELKNKTNYQCALKKVSLERKKKNRLIMAPLKDFIYALVFN